MNTTLLRRSAPTFSALVVPVSALVLWEIAVRASLLPPSLSAAPSSIVSQFFKLVLSGSLAKHCGLSVSRIIAAILLGASVGIMSGLLLSQSIAARRLLGPGLQLVAPIPVVVWMPFAVMFVGSGELYKITLGALAVFFILHIHTFQAVQAVHRDYVELAAIYEKSFWQKTRHVLLPAASPEIFTALRIALAFAWIVMFVVEYGSAREGSEGLGWFIANAHSVGRIEDEFAGVLLLAIVGFLSDLAVARIQRRTLDWADVVQDAEGGAVE